MGDIFVGQVGVKFSLTIQDDPILLAQATKKEILIKCRSGVIVWPATLDGDVLSYTTLSTKDLPCSGTYEIQPYFEGIGWNPPGSILTFLVKHPLKQLLQPLMI